MCIESLNELDEGLRLAADVVVVGGGACGLVLARGLAARGRDVLVLESGGPGEDDAHEALNAVDLAPNTFRPQESALRDAYHRNLARHWDGSRQGYGVRCRGLGGSTQAWAGKAAPFEAIDFATRSWVPLSGWPVRRDEIAPFVEQAEALLNLGPGAYDESLWPRIGLAPPRPPLAGEAFSPMFWKFARSRRSLTDIMRFGADFAAAPPPGVRVLTHATVTGLHSDPAGRCFTGLAAQSLSGRRVEITAPTCVLAASAIENARLLLLSRDANPNGLGNDHDCVGRYLTDHPTATIARFDGEGAGAMAARFGLYGHREAGRTHVYMHGLGLSERLQRAERALNGAVFVTEERADDDPFAAAGRLVRGIRGARLKDVGTVARSPLRLARGVAARAISRGYLPRPLGKLAVDIALQAFPNTVAQDFQNGRMPVKLTGLRVEATTEQPPLAENRITLSDNRDAFGLPRARIAWTPGDAARANLLRMGREFARAFEAEGLPAPIPADWVREADPKAAPVIDLGHSMGTTRMSNDPREGVVDPDCRVHGVEGLYAAGGSVLPTSGHANPTLMMLALTLRLADHLNATLPRRSGQGVSPVVSDEIEQPGL